MIDCNDICSIVDHFRDAFDEARADGNDFQEIVLSKQIKSQVRVDRAKWLDDAISKGDWDAVKEDICFLHILMGKVMTLIINNDTETND